MSECIPNLLDRSVGKVLRVQRLKLGLTIKDVARRVDRPHSFISKLEQGDKIITTGELDTICNLLNVNINEVINISKLESIGITNKGTNHV